MEYPVVARGIEDLNALVGKELGPSESIEITTEMVEAFADTTNDHQWIHVDVERATREGPYGGPIAHGYLVLSLVPPLLFKRLLILEGFAATLNYGANKIRFPAVARIGASLALTARLDSLQPKAKGQLGTFTLTFTATGSEKPCCVAEILLLFIE